MRVWAFGDVKEVPKISASTKDPARVWFQVVNSTGGYINYGENGIQRLDYLVSACERFGLKLVLPFVNTWDDWGGVSIYINAFSKNPGAIWYDIPQAQQIYKDYVKLLVNRYKKSPAIFSWQLGNEPRCQGCSLQRVTRWAAEISAYIKSIDPDHMVTLGDEGWLSPDDKVGIGGAGYNGYNGVSWSEVMKVPTIDYGTVHLYPSYWGYDYEWGADWIREHDEIGQRVSIISCYSDLDRVNFGTN
jgi:mannan endo-1,4-beta-mannosidase